MEESNSSNMSEMAKDLAKLATTLQDAFMNITEKEHRNIINKARAIVSDSRIDGDSRFTKMDAASVGCNLKLFADLYSALAVVAACQAALESTAICLKIDFYSLMEYCNNRTINTIGSNNPEGICLKAFYHKYRTTMDRFCQSSRTGGLPGL